MSSNEELEQITAVVHVSEEDLPLPEQQRKKRSVPTPRAGENREEKPRETSGTATLSPRAEHLLPPSTSATKPVQTVKQGEEPVSISHLLENLHTRWIQTLEEQVSFISLGQRLEEMVTEIDIELSVKQLSEVWTESLATITFGKVPLVDRARELVTDVDVEAIRSQIIEFVKNPLSEQRVSELVVEMGNFERGVDLDAVGADVDHEDDPILPKEIQGIVSGKGRARAVVVTDELSKPLVEYILMRILYEAGYEKIHSQTGVAYLGVLDMVQSSKERTKVGKNVSARYRVIYDMFKSKIISHLADRTVGIIIVPLDLFKIKSVSRSDILLRKFADFSIRLAENTIFHADHKFLVYVLSEEKDISALFPEDDRKYFPVPFVVWKISLDCCHSVRALLGVVGSAVPMHDVNETMKIYEDAIHTLSRAAMLDSINGKIEVNFQREREKSGESPEHRMMKYAIAKMLLEGESFDTPANKSRDELKASIKKVVVEGEVDDPHRTKDSAFCDVKMVMENGECYYYEYETLFRGGIANVLSTIAKYAGNAKVRIVLHPLSLYLHRQELIRIQSNISGIFGSEGVDVKIGTMVVDVEKNRALFMTVNEIQRYLKRMRRGEVDNITHR